MANITKRYTVCDIGLEDCDNSELHRARVTLDGRSRLLLLCNVHKQPLEPFLEGATPAGGRRGRVYSLDEIEKMKEPREMPPADKPRRRSRKVTV